MTDQDIKEIESTIADRKEAKEEFSRMLNLHFARHAERQTQKEKMRLAKEVGQLQAELGERFWRLSGCYLLLYNEQPSVCGWKRFLTIHRDDDGFLKELNW